MDIKTNDWDELVDAMEAASRRIEGKFILPSEHPLTRHAYATCIRQVASELAAKWRVGTHLTEMDIQWHFKCDVDAHGSAELSAVLGNVYKIRILQILFGSFSDPRRAKCRYRDRYAFDCLVEARHALGGIDVVTYPDGDGAG